jgi:hypothetical protein
MNAANSENTSSESDVRGRVEGEEWARKKIEKKMGMAMNLCRGPARANKAASD